MHERDPYSTGFHEKTDEHEIEQVFEHSPNGQVVAQWWSVWSFLTQDEPDHCFSLASARLNIFSRFLAEMKHIVK